MSLATLKKKSRNNRRFAPISGRGVNGFSLNGGYRNVGAVGQFRMISNNTRTPFRGTEPMGNGGCCGTYVNKPLNSGSAMVNDYKKIKKSSLNTKGMIDTKYQWLNGQYPNYWVQDMGNENNPIYEQSNYIAKLTNKSGGCVRGSSFISDSGDTQAPPCNGQKCSYFIGTRKFIRMPYAKVLNTHAISQSEYITLGGIAKNNCLPTRSIVQPFPMSVNNNGCDVNANNVQEAIDIGLLPPDYQG